MNLTRRTFLTGSGALLALPYPAQASDLFTLVEEYARADSHLTGTPGGEAAVDWLHRQLAAPGGRVTRHSYDYLRYGWRARLRIGGREVRTIPYLYEGVGDVHTRTPFLGSLAAADAAGARLAVLATPGNLVGHNSAPDRSVTGIPTLLVSGAEDLTGEIHAELRARRIPSRAENLVAWFGPQSNEPVVVSTPLTGWFSCAAERGPSLAIGLDLASRLASRGVPVLFVAATGDELDSTGLTAYLEDWDDPAHPLRPKAVIHLGPSIAAGVPDGSGGLVLAPTREAAARPGITTKPALAAALKAGGFTPRTVNPFAGTEIVLWRQYLRPEVPTLALMGTFPQLRTPDDLASATTSPALLATVQASVHAAVDAILS